MINQRTPAAADKVVGRGGTSNWLLVRLDHEEFWWRPSWMVLRDGKGPLVNTSVEPGEWPEVAVLRVFRLGHLLPEELSTA